MKLKTSISEKKGDAVGMYAVMRHPQRGVKHAKFSSLHGSKQSAETEAKRLAGESLDKHGLDGSVAYYVVHVVSVHGIIDGRPVGA
jgi:hypothetical protein